MNACPCVSCLSKARWEACRYADESKLGPTQDRGKQDLSNDQCGEHVLPVARCLKIMASGPFWVEHKYPLQLQVRGIKVCNQRHPERAHAEVHPCSQMNRRFCFRQFWPPLLPCTFHVLIRQAANSHNPASGSGAVQPLRLVARLAPKTLCLPCASNLFP